MRSAPRPLAILALALFAWTCADAAHAQGMIIVGGPPVPSPRSASVPAPALALALQDHRIEVKIVDQVAHTRIVQNWRNDTDVDQEAIYLFPVPKGAAIGNFAIAVGAQTLETRLLAADEARRIYEDIVRRRQDPALLEFVGRDLIQARVYPVPARGEQRIEIAYSQAIPMDQGLCRYVAGLTLTGFHPAPLRALSVSVDLSSAHQVKTVYSPSHPVAVHRLSDQHVHASFELAGGTSDRDFELYFGLSDEAMGLHALTWRQPGEDGYFLMMLAPRFEIAESELLERDVVFVLDTSGSMEGDKIRQARAALAYCLRSLSPRDRFNVLSFNTAVQGFANAMTPASPENVARGVAFTAGLAAHGGTNIQAALRTALALLDDPDRARQVVFLSDGLPTIGETDMPAIEREVALANAKGARLYVFGVGNDVNTHFLDRLAVKNRGLSDYVRESENIEAKVAAFFTKLSSPVLGDVKVSVPDAHAYDFYPPDMPDLFRGAQLLVFGRYRGKGKLSVTVKGRLEGREQAYVFQQAFPEIDLGNPFLPRIWASQKIGWLLDEIRLHGRSRELVDEVIALSRKHGIMTEYTSFLIDEDGTVAPDRLRTAALDNFRRAFEVQNGDWAISQCQNGWAYKNNDNVAALNVYLNQVGQSQRLDRVRSVGSKVFYRRGAQWVDVEALGLTAGEVVDNFSARYFDLTENEKDFNLYQSLGGEVIVKQGDRVIHCK